ncbi:hypothetical protein QQ045_002859 [Rhodiola kirilowii]
MERNQNVKKVICFNSEVFFRPIKKKLEFLGRGYSQLLSPLLLTASSTALPLPHFFLSFFLFFRCNLSFFLPIGTHGILAWDMKPLSGLPCLFRPVGFVFSDLVVEECG